MQGVDWLSDPDAAFAQARAGARPLFLYWGASWCPPCNRIKATVFSSPGFAELAQSFVALHIDGDGPGAQRLAERFHLRSYPTLVVFRSDGAEVTRLPCELAPARFIEILKVALAARLTAAQSLSAALSRERPLSDDEWRLLSYYSWDTDEHQLLKNLDLAATFASMRGGCTLPDAALRLEWHALHAAAVSGKGGIDQRAAAARLEETLADPRAVRGQMDIVTNQAVDLVRFLTPADSDQRVALTHAWAAALARIESDSTVNVADQLAALRTRVRMSRLGAAIPHLADTARASVAAAVGAVDAGNEPALRHQVINTAAGVLSDAGLLDEAELLLRDELDASHAPFYFMHNLAAIARKRGDPARMVGWYEQAWLRATGPATRLQWGATYLQALLEFLPHELERIERFSAATLAELNGMDDAFSQRNGTQMHRIAAKLALQDRAVGPHTAALREAVQR